MLEQKWVKSVCITIFWNNWYTGRILPWYRTTKIERALKIEYEKFQTVSKTCSGNSVFPRWNIYFFIKYCAFSPFFPILAVDFDQTKKTFFVIHPCRLRPLLLFSLLMSIWGFVLHVYRKKFSNTCYGKT